MRSQEDHKEEGEDGVDVHGELEGGEVEAGQEREEAINSTDFVEK